MRSTLITLSLAACVSFTGGCAAQKAEHDRLINERAEFQSRYESENQINEADNAKIASLEQRITDLNAEVTKTKAQVQKTEDDMAAEEKSAAAKLAAVTDAGSKANADMQESQASLKKSQDDLAASKANSTAQSAALTEKLVGLQSQIETLSKENASLKAELKEKAATPTAAPSTMP